MNPSQLHGKFYSEGSTMVEWGFYPGSLVLTEKLFHQKCLRCYFTRAFMICVFRCGDISTFTVLYCTMRPYNAPHAGTCPPVQIYPVTKSDG